MGERTRRAVFFTLAIIRRDLLAILQPNDD